LHGFGGATINSSDNILIMCLAQGGILLDITTPSNDGDCLFWYQFINLSSSIHGRPRWIQVHHICFDYPLAYLKYLK
jgi:hypothetical protein